MNKSNKILLVVFSFIVVCVIGYALFSENITVTGTAIAKGDFSYSIETMKGFNSEIKSSNMYSLLNNYGEPANSINFMQEVPVSDSSITHTENTITYTSNLTNAGQLQYFTAKITNTGTIPIDFDIYYDFSDTQTISGNLIMSDGNLFDVTKVEDAALGHYGNAYGFITSDYLNAMNLKYQITGLYDIFSTKEIFDDSEVRMNEGKEGLPRLETGDSIYLLFISQWSNNLNFNDNVKGFDVEGTHTITLPIKQATVE